MTLLLHVENFAVRTAPHRLFWLNHGLVKSSRFLVVGFWLPDTKIGLGIWGFWLHLLKLMLPLDLVKNLLLLSDTVWCALLRLRVLLGYRLLRLIRNTLKRLRWDVLKLMLHRAHNRLLVNRV